MHDGKLSGPRPMNVFVRPGSQAETICRRYAAGAAAAPKKAQVRTKAIAGGFPAHPELNLRDQGGKIIQDLVFTNFYVGGDAWSSDDIRQIDSNLSKAMSDPHLNNVLLQYFRGAPGITSTFRPSTVVPGPAPARVSQSDVEARLTALHAGGTLVGFDFANTVFNFLLPPGTVLTTDDGGSDNKSSAHAKKGKGKKAPKQRGEVEEAADSLHGLGGFHGSVRSDGVKLYYAVGAFSEGSNGIVAFDQPWKNVVATFYHELVEARTDADVAENLVAWVNDENPSLEIGDIPMELAGQDLSLVMKEVPLADGSGTVPIQLMWSNAVGGPEGPIAVPHPSQDTGNQASRSEGQTNALSPRSCPIREASTAKAISVEPGDPAHQAVFDEPVLNVSNIQGSILTGFNKSHRILLFLKVDRTKIHGFKRWLRSQIDFIATSDEVIAFTRLFKVTRARRGREGTVKSTWTNIAFSFPMLKALNGEASQFIDDAFRQGLAARSASLGDPTEGRYSAENWFVGGTQNEADVMLIIEADDRADMLNEFSRIQESIDGLQQRSGSLVDTGISILFKDEGANLPEPLTGHEHFGFLDGVSQPGLRGLLSHDKNDVLTLRQNPNKRDKPGDSGKIATAQGKPGQDLLYPGEFVFGYPRQNPKDDPRFDGPNADPGDNSLDKPPAQEGGHGPAGPKWAQDGSFLVYRRLRQDVGAFHRFLHDVAAKYGIADPDNASAARLVGSRLVGRWPSGAPVMRAPNAENPALADDDCKNNNFEFQDKTDPIHGPAQYPSACVDNDHRFPQSPGDPEGMRCPFSGHIRKSYPRDDHAKDEGNPNKPPSDPNFNESTTQTHRLLRRGLPYGPVSRSTPDAPVDDDADRGLQFLAYQTSIHNQFEFVIRN